MTGSPHPNRPNASSIIVLYYRYYCSLFFLCLCFNFFVCVLGFSYGSRAVPTRGHFAHAPRTAVAPAAIETKNRLNDHKQFSRFFYFLVSVARFLCCCLSNGMYSIMERDLPIRTLRSDFLAALDRAYLPASFKN